MPFLHDDSLTWPTLKQFNQDSGRVYQVEATGAIYPSITRVLAHKEKPFLKAWMEKVGPEEAEHRRNKAGVRGTTIHAISEDYLNNRPVTKPWPHIQEMWIRMRTWIDAHVTKVYAQERDTYSGILRVAGRMDLLAEIDGTIAVGDFKNALRPKKLEWVHDYFLQGTFYAICVQELTGRKVRKIVFPVVSPGELQVFETTPGKHIEELQDRVSDFYAAQSQTISLDIPAAV